MTISADFKQQSFASVIECFEEGSLIFDVLAVYCHMLCESSRCYHRSEHSPLNSGV